MVVPWYPRSANSCTATDTISARRAACWLSEHAISPYLQCQVAALATSRPRQPAER